MIITRKELSSLKEPKTIHYHSSQQNFHQFSYLKALSNVEATLTFFYDAMDQLQLHIVAKGNMICPCAVSLEDVEVPFSLEETESVSFDDKVLFNEEATAFYIEESTSAEEILLAFVLPIVPIKVVKKGKIEYPSGDGWKVMTEAEFIESRKKKRDPRWDKLLDFEMEKEE